LLWAFLESLFHNERITPVESESPNQETTQPEGTKRPSDKDSEQAKPPNTPAVIPAEPQPPPAPRNHKVSWKADRDWLDYIKFAAELIGLCILLAYTTFAALQWSEMRKAAKAAEGANEIANKNLTLSQRPWLGVDGTPRLLEPVEFTKVAGGETNVKFTMGFTIKNFGNQPALHVGFHAVPETVENFTTTERYLQAFQATANATCGMADSFTRPEPRDAGATGPYIFPNNTFTEIDHNTVRGGPNTNFDWRFQIIGCIAYVDPNNGVHHTRFCFRANSSFRRITPRDTLYVCPVNQTADSFNPCPVTQPAVTCTA